VASNSNACLRQHRKERTWAETHAQPDFIHLNAVGWPGSSRNSRCHCGPEKFVQRGVTNSRRKDFYDLQVLSSRLAFDGKTLSEAVRKTFLNRGTELPANGVPLAFMPESYDETAPRLSRDL
jgi:hypothetical protein